MREAVITDPKHGRALPAGTALRRLVAALLRRQRDAALVALRYGAVSVPPPDASLIEALLPVFRRYFAQGAQAAAGRPRKSARRRWRKDVGGAGLADFDVYNPATTEAVRRMVFDFLRSLGEGTSDMLREALIVSLEGGEPGLQLQARLVPIFGTQRAFTIGLTESSRAVHAGQLAAARAEGVVTARTWLASGDACDACLSLDGKTVGLDEPFATGASRNPAYATVMYPPLHPRCMCTVTEDVG